MRIARSHLVVMALGLAIVAAVGVSTLPGDLVFFLPAIGLLWAAVFVALRRPRCGSGHLPLWITVACWLWLIVLAANPIWSVWPEMSIWQALGIGLIPAWVLGLHRLLADDALWDRLEWCVFGAAALMAGCMAYQYFVLGERADGFFPDANAAAAVLYAALLPLLYRLTAGRDAGVARWLLGGLLLLLSVGLWTSFSRGGIGSWLIALVGTGIVFALAGTNTLRRRFGACLAVFALAWALVYLGPQQPIDRNVAHLSQDSSLHVRLLIWQSTLDIYKEAPVLGTGLGTFVLEYSRYRSPGDTGTAGAMAHNDYLQMLAEGGPLSLALLIAFVLGILIGAIRLFRRLLRGRHDRDGPRQNAMLRDMGLFAALLALAVHATVNFIFYVPLLALLAGLYAARLAGRHALTDTPLPLPDATESLRRVARPVFVLVALLSLLSVGTAILTSTALHTGKDNGPDYLSTAPDAYQLALAVNAINPLDYRSHFYTAHAQAISAELQRKLGHNDKAVQLAIGALAGFQQVLAIKRPDCSTAAISGRLLREFHGDADRLRAAGVWQDPAPMLRQAITDMPFCMATWVALAKLRAQQGRLGLAIKVLDHAQTWMNIATVPGETAARMLVTLARLVNRAGDRKLALSVLANVLSAEPGYEPAQALRAQLMHQSDSNDNHAR